MRLLVAHQELGMLALGVQSISGDHAPGQVQRRQQRGERGDLVGLAVHAGLTEHGTGFLVSDREQVNGPLARTVDSRSSSCRSPGFCGGGGLSSRSRKPTLYPSLRRSGSFPSFTHAQNSA
jgi:hypothetical protein